MSGPSPYPEDSGPFDAAAQTPPGEKVFTADDGIDHEAGETDPLEQGDESGHEEDDAQRDQPSPGA